MYVDMYPDDTRTVPVSTSLHVYWCGNVGAQSRSVTTVSHIHKLAIQKLFGHIHLVLVSVGARYSLITLVSRTEL